MKTIWNLLVACELGLIHMRTEEHKKKKERKKKVNPAYGLRLFWNWVPRAHIKIRLFGP